MKTTTVASRYGYLVVSSEESSDEAGGLSTFYGEVDAEFRRLGVAAEYCSLVDGAGRVYRVEFKALGHLDRGPNGVHIGGFVAFSKIPEQAQALLSDSGWLPIVGGAEG